MDDSVTERIATTLWHLTTKAPWHAVRVGFEQDAETVQADLESAGYEVVKLPDPTDVVPATDDDNGSLWFSGGDVLVFDDGEIHLFGEVWDAGDAEDLALGLLAAVNRAKGFIHV